MIGTLLKRFKKRYWDLYFYINYNFLSKQQEEVEEARRKQDEATKALMVASSTPQHHHLAENNQEEMDSDEVPNGDISAELNNSEDPIFDPVEDRRTLAEKNERLQNQLKVRNLMQLFLKTKVIFVRKYIHVNESKLRSF